MFDTDPYQPDDWTPSKPSRKWLWALLAFLVVAAAVAAGIYVPILSDPRIRLADREPLQKGHYTAFAQPWAGSEDRLLSRWANHADRISVDLETIPNNSEIAWLWPWAPRGGGGGVWGYNIIAFGNYDGGVEEAAVTPHRVSEIKHLSQDFNWSQSLSVGAANVLTEFYLRSNPADSESKLLEIGWFLHSPSRTREFVERGRQIGVYSDPGNRKWRVAITEKYCTFMPLDGGDVRTGRIDMLAALRWLQAKNVVKPDAWFTGVAFGVEPIWGAGSVNLNRWSVSYD